MNALKGLTKERWVKRNLLKNSLLEQLGWYIFYPTKDPNGILYSVSALSNDLETYKKTVFSISKVILNEYYCRKL